MRQLRKEQILSVIIPPFTSVTNRKRILRRQAVPCFKNPNFAVREKMIEGRSSTTAKLPFFPLLLKCYESLPFDYVVGSFEKSGS